jgi:hypothetical protein
MAPLRYFYGPSLSIYLLPKMMEKDNAGKGSQEEILKMSVEFISLLMFLILTYLLSQRLGSFASELNWTRRDRFDQSRELTEKITREDQKTEGEAGQANDVGH